MSLARIVTLLVALSALLLGGCGAPAEERSIQLWHSYRGEERVALEELVRRFSESEGVAVELLAVPYDAFAAKLNAAIPFGDGPDVFIDAHERLGTFDERGLVAPVGDALEERGFIATALEAVSLEGRRLGVPLSQKSVALYYRTDLVREPPPSFERLASVLRAPLPEGSFLLVYENRGVYMHAPLLHAWGGSLLDEEDGFGFTGPAAEASLAHAKRLIDEGKTPTAGDGALVTQLFQSGKAAYAISGPWLASDLAAEVPYAVAVLPELEATGRRLEPLLTVEAAMLSPTGAGRPEARKLARFLASREAAELRQRVARTVSARSDVRLPEGDHFLRVFRDQAEHAVPMPASVAMRAVWEPADKALRKVMHGTASAPQALAEAKRRFDDVRRILPPPASPTPGLILLGGLSLVLAFVLLRRVRAPSFRRRLRESGEAYRYLAHAVIAIGLLVFAPLFAGAALSLYAGQPNDLYYVGFANFVEILTARGGALFGSGSFYFVLAVTLLWTAVNLVFHLGLGVLLGVILSRPVLRLKAVYRVLLILPWAVPNYVTALAWKGMFHQQFGAVTALHRWAAGFFGFEMEPVAWFSEFSTAFAANAATNIWLGFPFMMVVTIAALTSMPKEVLEAAEVDGATRFERFRLVTLPIIRPSLVPATVLGAIWTFNMFNVVFLVSGGEPDGTTDILVSEAYRWAFTRQAQYGYAAAYAVLIFLLLSGVTRLPSLWRERRMGRGSAPKEEAGMVTVVREAEA